MADGKIVLITGADKVVIPAVRKAFVYPFVATNWSDLRLGFFMSITAAANDDLTTGLAETLTTTSSADRVFIGFKTNSDARPDASEFYGISNMKASDPFTTASSVVDPGLGGAGNEWVYRGPSNVCVFGRAGVTQFNNQNPGISPEISQNAGFTNGRGVLILLRMTRTAGSATVGFQSVSIVDVDIGRSITTDHFSNTCKANDLSDPTSIRSRFRTDNFANEALTHTFFSVPDAFYAYWPFNNSRLRLHSICIEKFG